MFWFLGNKAHGFLINLQAVACLVVHIWANGIVNTGTWYVHVNVIPMCVGLHPGYCNVISLL